MRGNYQKEIGWDVQNMDWEVGVEFMYREFGYTCEKLGGTFRFFFLTFSIGPCEVVVFFPAVRLTCLCFDNLLNSLFYVRSSAHCHCIDRLAAMCITRLALQNEWAFLLFNRWSNDYVRIRYFFLTSNIDATSPKRLLSLLEEEE